MGPVGYSINFLLLGFPGIASSGHSKAFPSLGEVSSLLSSSGQCSLHAVPQRWSMNTNANHNVLFSVFKKKKETGK